LLRSVFHAKGITDVMDLSTPELEAFRIALTMAEQAVALGLARERRQRALARAEPAPAVSDVSSGAVQKVSPECSTVSSS
jgi:hypothetical protein